MTIAKWWSCRDPERLDLDSPEEAIVELFDNDIPWSGMLTEEDIAKVCPLVVEGYAPAVINSNYVYSCAESAVDRFEESLAEDFGDPEEDSDVLPYAVKQNLREKLFDLYSVAAASMTPFLCVHVDKKVYTAEQVSAILHEECPEWFEEFA